MRYEKIVTLHFSVVLAQPSSGSDEHIVRQIPKGILRVVPSIKVSLGVSMLIQEWLLIASHPTIAEETITPSYPSFLEVASDAIGIAVHIRLACMMTYILESDRDLPLLMHLHSPGAKYL